MNTLEFRTRTEFIKKDNISIEGICPIGIDIGYSGVKLFYPKGYACFPSFCIEQKQDTATIGVADESELVYTDLDNGNSWLVGDLATNVLKSSDTVQEDSLFGRDRYYSPQFKVLLCTGLGIALWDEPTNMQNHVYLETGLPPAYLKMDSPELKAAISAAHNFKLTRGQATKTFHIELTENTIHVIQQPMGTLYSISVGNDGNPTPQAKNYFTSDILIFDAGFGTLDNFLIRNRRIEESNTNDKLGMKRILEETRNSITKVYKEEVSIPAMQKCLKSGTVMVRDRKSFKTEYKPIGEFLEKANQKVCEEAIENIRNYLFDVSYLVITGGTGAAWEGYLKDTLKEMKNLTVVTGNYGNNLPIFYANTRGYYFYQLSRLKRALSAKTL